MTCHLARLSALACLLLLTGCGEKRPPVAPVSGRVLYRGQPVPVGTSIGFAPIGTGENTATPGKPASAYVTEGGHYQLSTFGSGDGALVGSHRVSLSAPGDSDEPGYQPLPGKLTNDVVEVKPGSNTIDLVLE